LFHHAVPRPLRGDHEAVELAREAGGEFADVNHLLHFAHALDANLAHFQADQFAQRLLQFTQRVAEVTDHLTPARRGPRTPRLERLIGPRHQRLVGGRRSLNDLRQRLAVGWVVGYQFASAAIFDPAVGAGARAEIGLLDIELFE